MKPLTGVVISTKTDKTATVAVTSRWQHPLYKKTLKRTKKYLVQDDIGVKAGNTVTITSTRPISKRKRFKIASVDTKLVTAKNKDIPVTKN